MTWSYNLTTLKTAQKDQVRFLIGDTDKACPQLEDEEIDFTLSEVSSPFGAAALCCRSLASAMSRLADQSSGNSKMSYSQRAKAYSMRAAEYENQYAARGGVLPFAGGISISDIMARQQDTDRAQPQFGIGMDDNDIPVPASRIEPLDSPEPERF